MADATSTMPFWFNFWFPLGNALLTLVLASATAFFGWGQHSLGKAQLRIALFDRRVVAYDAMKRFLADIMMSGTATTDSLVAMLRETKYAQFLFEESDDISEFINHFYKQNVDLKYAQEIHQNIRDLQQEAERLRLIQRQHDLLLWFGKQGGIVDDKFRPYLQLW